MFEENIERTLDCLLARENLDIKQYDFYNLLQNKNFLF